MVQPNYRCEFKTYLQAVLGEVTCDQIEVTLTLFGSLRVLDDSARAANHRALHVLLVLFF
jgi:hypothetical protein